MKKSDLRKIIKEEIKRIIEGGDMILLKSIGMMIDEYTGALYPKGKDSLYGEIEQGTSGWKQKISKLDSNDKKIVKSLGLNEGWQDDYKQQEKFELGTPVGYNGESGEVTMNKKPYMLRSSGTVSKPGTVKGISFYPFRGTLTTFTVPDWYKVKKF